MFENLLVKKKLLLSFHLVGHYEKPLAFFSANGSRFLGLSNLHLNLPYKFKYVLYNKWLVKKNLFLFNKKFAPNRLLHSYFISNISFLLNFGSRFIFQRLFLIFGANFFFKHNWWERNVKFSYLVTNFFIWWFTRKPQTKSFFANKYVSYFSSNKKFFYWDPSDKVFLHNNYKFIMRQISQVYTFNFFYKFDFFANAVFAQAFNGFEKIKFFRYKVHFGKVLTYSNYIFYV